MAKQKFYVVWIGREPGVFNNWDECETQVKGFSGAKFKSFKTRKEAEDAFKCVTQKCYSNEQIDDINSDDVPWHTNI